MTGTGAAWRPASSARIASSTRPASSPPHAAATPIAAGRSSWIWSHRPGSHPSGSAARTRSVGHSFSKKVRTTACSAACSSPSEKSARRSTKSSVIATRSAPFPVVPPCRRPAFRVAGIAHAISECHTENAKRARYRTPGETMDAAKLPKISADSHIDEPHDLWFERMDRDLRDRGAASDPSRTGRRLDAGRRRQPGRVGQQVSRGGGDPGAGADRRGVARRAARDAAHRLRERRDRLPHDRALRVEREGPRGRTAGLHGLQRLDPGTPRWTRAHPARSHDPDVGPRDGDRRGAAHGRGGLDRRAPGAARGIPGMELLRVGPALGRAPRRRQAGGDAPGHRPRHDLLPRLGFGHDQPAHHAVDGAARRCDS